MTFYLLCNIIRHCGRSRLFYYYSIACFLVFSAQPISAASDDHPQERTLRDEVTTRHLAVRLEPHLTLSGKEQISVILHTKELIPCRLILGIDNAIFVSEANTKSDKVYVRGTTRTARHQLNMHTSDPAVAGIVVTPARLDEKATDPAPTLYLTKLSNSEWRPNQKWEGEWEITWDTSALIENLEAYVIEPPSNVGETIKLEVLVDYVGVDGTTETGRFPAMWKSLGLISFTMKSPQINATRQEQLENYMETARKRLPLLRDKVRQMETASELFAPSRTSTRDYERMILERLVQNFQRNWYAEYCKNMNPTQKLMHDRLFVSQKLLSVDKTDAVRIYEAFRGDNASFNKEFLAKIQPVFVQESARIRKEIVYLEDRSKANYIFYRPTTGKLLANGLELSQWRFPTDGGNE